MPPSLPEISGRSKRGKGREPSGSSPECSESGNNRFSRRIPTITGSLRAHGSIAFFLKRICWIGFIIPQTGVKIKLKYALIHCGSSIQKPERCFPEAKLRKRGFRHDPLQVWKRNIKIIAAVANLRVGQQGEAEITV